MSENLINPVENEDLWEARSSPSEAKSARGAQMFKGGGGEAPPLQKHQGGLSKREGGRGLAEGDPPSPAYFLMWSAGFPSIFTFPCPTSGGGRNA